MKYVSPLLLAVMLAHPLFAQIEPSYDIFRYRVADNRNKVWTDQAITATGLGLVLGGLATLAIPLATPEFMSSESGRSLFITSLTSISVGITLAIGGGIAWGVHNKQFQDLLEQQQAAQISGSLRWQLER